MKDLEIIKNEINRLKRDIKSNREGILSILKKYVLYLLYLVAGVGIALLGFYLDYLFLVILFFWIVYAADVISTHGNEMKYYAINNSREIKEKLAYISSCKESIKEKEKIMNDKKVELQNVQAENNQKLKKIEEDPIIIASTKCADNAKKLNNEQREEMIEKIIGVMQDYRNKSLKLIENPNTIDYATLLNDTIDEFENLNKEIEIKLKQNVEKEQLNETLEYFDNYINLNSNEKNSVRTLKL